MWRLSSVIVVGAMFAPAAAAPRGEVVRVERKRGTAGVPRFCEMIGGTNGTCLGATSPGDRVTVFDLSQGGALGVLQIEKSEPSTDKWMCPRTDPLLFVVTSEVVSGDADKMRAAGRLIGLRGVSLDPHVAKVVQNVDPPLGRAGEDVAAAIDSDGNGSADIIVVRFSCDEHGTPVSTGMPGICFDTYLDRGVGQGMQRVNEDIIPVCM